MTQAMTLASRHGALVIQWAKEIEDLEASEPAFDCRGYSPKYPPTERIYWHLWSISELSELLFAVFTKSNKQMDREMPRATVLTEQFKAAQAQRNGHVHGPVPLAFPIAALNELNAFYTRVAQTRDLIRISEKAIPLLHKTEVQLLMDLLFRVTCKFDKYCSNSLKKKKDVQSLRQEQMLNNFTNSFHERQFLHESQSKLIDLYYQCERIHRIFLCTDEKQLREVASVINNIVDVKQKESDEAADDWSPMYTMYPHVVCLNDLHRTGALAPMTRVYRP